MIQIIRYRESPVGPYDELAILPGTFEWSREGPDGQRTTSRNLKISRMYVSQKHTCYNGRASKCYSAFYLLFFLISFLHDAAAACKCSVNILVVLVNKHYIMCTLHLKKNHNKRS